MAASRVRHGLYPQFHRSPSTESHWLELGPTTGPKSLWPEDVPLGHAWVTRLRRKWDGELH